MPKSKYNIFVNRPDQGILDKVDSSTVGVLPRSPEVSPRTWKIWLRKGVEDDRVKLPHCWLSIVSKCSDSAVQGVDISDTQGYNYLYLEILQS